jgi:hypothetical protein
MNEDTIRSAVREVLARHLTGAQPQRHAPAGVPLSWHASHARYRVLSGEESDGPCLIEPAVACNHCGYCQSHGH